MMHYVIVGNGPAGNTAAEAIRRCDPAGEVTIFSAESHPSYYRPMLPLLVEGKVSQDLLFRDSLHTPLGVTIRLGTPVKALHPYRQRVVLESDEELSYDRLLLAMGSSPVLPPIPNLRGNGVFTLRTLDDANALRQVVKEAKEAVVIGGGRIGIKAVLALRLLGLGVTVVEMLPRLIPMQLDDAASRLVSQMVSREDIHLRLGEQVKEIIRRDGKVVSVVTASGETIPADLVIVAVGVKANLELASRAGIKVARGILVDKYLQTSAPGVYAAGDCVETADLVSGEAMVSGTWTNAVTMGNTTGENMTGGKKVFLGALNVYNAMEVVGLPVISVGIVNPGNGYEVYSWRRGDDYRKLVFQENRLVGLLMVGDVSRAGVYVSLLREGTDISLFKEDLIAGRVGYGRFITPAAPVREKYQPTYVRR